MSLKYKISLSFVITTILLVIKLNAQTFVPIKVTGFNHDLIAEGSGGVNRAENTTTTTFDDKNDAGDNVMYSKDFRGNKNPTTPPPFGLPNDGIIRSKNLLGAIFQLAPYDQKNALVLKGQNESGTLILETPGVFSKIAFLAASANNDSDFDLVLNFSDNTNLPSKFQVRDWFNGSPFAIDSIGRIHRSDFGTHFADNFSHSGNNPRLYDDQLTISPPFDTKILTSITITKTSTSGRTAIFSIIGITPVNAPSAPVATQATNINANSFTANWNGSLGATAYFLDVSTTSNFTAILPSYNNRNVGNVLNFSITGISNTQNYFYRIRAANASGVSPSSNTINVINIQCPSGTVAVSTQAQIDNFKLSYPTCTIINGNLNITDGLDITNVNGFSNITEITDQLNIVNNGLLNDLSGFANLNKVASNFWIAGNKALKQIKEFTKLTFAGQLYFGYNDQLLEISGFQKLVALPDLTIENNNALTLINFNSDVNLTDRFMTFKNNPKLQKIQSIGIKLWVSNTVTIENNASLTDLTAFNNISIIGELIIKDIPNLQNLNSFVKVTNLNGSIQLINNSKLNDITGLSNVLPGSIKGSGLIIKNNTNVTLCDLSNFCTYLRGTGPRDISGNAGNCLNEQAVLNICNGVSAPLALAATNISTTGFTANWQAVSGATKYFLDIATDPNFTSIVLNNYDAGNSLSVVIGPTPSNTTYYYRVRANNGFSTSSNSNVISVTTLNVAPSAPTALAATNIGSTSFTANWLANGNTTGYFLDVSTNSNFSSFITGYNNLSTGNVTSTNITGLTLNTTYYYRIRANNAVGTSPNSNIISLTTSNSAPSAPTATAATNITSTGFTANWNLIGNATEYFIDVSTNSNFSNFVTGYNDLSVGNVQNRNITGLTLNTTYYYRIRARNAVGTSPNSNIISLTTSNSAPSAPTATAATNITSTGFTANWNLIGNATGYFIDVSTNSNFSSFVSGYNNLSVGNVQNLNIIGLTLNTTYYYRIRANNAVGTSSNSNVISLTTLDNGGNCTIDIPDARFKNYLIGNLNINRNGDTEIQCAEAENYSGEINCSNLQIIDLTGIEAFINLTGLKCNDNLISNIDVSKNTKLKTITCYNNQITKLNLQLNTQLTEVYCYNNKLTGLNTEKNVLLQKLGCNDNLIKDLDISANNNLTQLWCYNNKLAFLNLANGINEDMALIEAFNNPDLECIKVDKEDYSNNNWRSNPFKFDAQHMFKEDCGPCDEWREKLNSNFLVSANACIGDSIHVIDYSNIDLNEETRFTWDFGNGVTSTERDPVILYNKDGNYTISLVVNNIECKSFIIQKDISIMSCLSNPSSSHNYLSLYPNPNSGQATLFIKLLEKSPLLVKVYNAKGELVKQNNYEETQLLVDQLNISEEGVYFIQLIHKNGIEKFKTIVLK